MATKTVKLLLTESVDNLGIVGDVVSVRLGFARNYLLPRELATEPSDEKLAALAEKRVQAEKERAEQMASRREMIAKMDGCEVTLERSCNDIGHLYGSVTQHDIARALAEKGFEVKAREVRIPYTIKRLDSFDILVKLASDMEATIRLSVIADRAIEEDSRVEMEFDNEGNLIEPSAAPKLAKAGASDDTDADENAPTAAANDESA